MVSITKVVEDVSIDLDKLIKDNNVEIFNRIETDQILIAPKNIRSIIYNLLSNAIKYSSPDRTPQVHIQTKRSEHYLLIEVKDNGIGIAAQHQEKMFTMFKRFHTHVEGTGIGLYIVKRTVENAGGKIEVESKVDVGTTFRVYLPYTQ
jgi:signal transduction histidine kinase